MTEPVYLQIVADGNGELAFGGVTRSRYRLCAHRVFVTINGSDKSDELSGAAWLGNDGVLEIGIAVHNGDDVIHSQVTSSTAC